MADRRRMLLQGPIAPALFRLAMPIILGNALQSGYQLTDAFWVGRLGAPAVAAVAVSFPVTFLVIALGAGLVNHVAAQTMVMVAVTSVILGTVGYVVTPYLLMLLGVAPDVYQGALGFMRVSFIGIIFVFLYAMFQALMRGIGETRIPLIIVLGTVVLNFALDPLFIFGWGPVPGRGVMGAAIATLVTQALAALIGMVILLRGRHGIKLSWRGLVPDPPYIKRAFFRLSRIGRVVDPRARSRCHVVSRGELRDSNDCRLWRWFNGFTGRHDPSDGLVYGGVDPSRAEYRCRQYPARIPYRPFRHFGGIRRSDVGRDHGLSVRPPHRRVLRAARRRCHCRGRRFVRIMCLAWGGMGIQLCVVAAFRASGNMLMAMVIALVSQWMIQFPVAYVLSNHTVLQADGLWWSFPVTNILVALVSLGWFARGTWKDKRRRSAVKAVQRRGAPREI